MTQCDSNLIKSVCLKEGIPAACLLHALSKTVQTDLKNAATWDMLTCSCRIPINRPRICDLAGNGSVKEALLLRCIQSFLAALTLHHGLQESTDLCNELLGLSKYSRKRELH